MESRGGLYTHTRHAGIQLLSGGGSSFRDTSFGTSRWKSWQTQGLVSYSTTPTEFQTLVLPEEYLT